MNPATESPTATLNMFTRRSFLKTTALTVGAVAILSQGRALAANGSGDKGSNIPDEYFLLCTQEPAESDWGEKLAASGLGTNSLALGLLQRDRYLGFVAAVTNVYHPQWVNRCIRVGEVGRNNDWDWAKVCVAACYRAKSGSGTEVKLTPKHYASLMLDIKSGKIGVSDSGKGHTVNGVAGGSGISGVAKIDITGNNTRKVTLDITWSVTWEGFTGPEIQLIKYLRFGLDFNNQLTWTKSAKFIFESFPMSDFERVQKQYKSQQVTRGIVTTDENGARTIEFSPFGHYQNTTTGVNSLASTTRLVRDLTNMTNGHVENCWEF